MASVYDLKPRFQGLLRPLTAAMVRLGLRANAVTLAAVLGSIAVGVFVALSPGRPLLLLSLPIWLFVRMALNAIDGMMAREFGQSSDRGAVLNELGDVVSDLALYLPLAVAYPAAALSAIAFAIGATLTEFCGVLGRALGAARHYEGPMGKSDRALVAGTMGLGLALFGEVAVALPWVLWAGTALELLTCVNRLRGALRDLRAPSGEVTR